MPPKTQMQKQRAQILMVDPPNRRIHGTLKEGTSISIAVFEIPSHFRWPQEGEIWSIYRQNQYWMLGDRVHTQDEDFNVEDMTAGEIRLDSDVIKDKNGHQLLSLPFRIPILDAAPADPTADEAYYDRTLTALRIYDGQAEAWITVS